MLPKYLLSKYKRSRVVTRMKSNQLAILDRCFIAQRNAVVFIKHQTKRTYAAACQVQKTLQRFFGSKAES